ncbi:MAG: glutamate racemase [Hyphomicrobiales bacterium]|nr:glutamate racemase [Hyphomicrobiales bacterium]
MPDNRLILTFDSGLGGLTVYREVANLLPCTRRLFLADDAAFPYGRLEEDAVVARVMAVLGAALALVSPDVVVIACNTASTAVLSHLRAAYPHTEFVGTVPAIKPAAALSRSGLITVLGTSGTVRREYTHGLIRDHAAHREVMLVGSETLAGLAEQYAHEPEGKGDAFDVLLAAELAPCFIEKDGRRTDHIVLACTHYPLLRERLEQLAGTRVGWPVTFVDPAPAIARRVEHVLTRMGHSTHAPTGPERPRVWTSSGGVDDLSRKIFADYGLEFSPEFSFPFNPGEK